MSSANKKPGAKSLTEQDNAHRAAPGEAASPRADCSTPVRGRETGGPAGLEPTRYGDWEKAGRCIDF